MNLLYSSSFYYLIYSSNFFLSAALDSLFNKGDTDLVLDLTGGLEGVLYFMSGIGLASNLYFSKTFKDYEIIEKINKLCKIYLQKFNF